MSDEHEHHHHAPMFAFQMGPTPEELEQARMSQEAVGHETRQFLDKLTVDELDLLSKIIRTVSISEASGPFYAGLITGIRQQKFNVCLACGRDHDADLAEMIPQPKSEVKAEDEGEPAVGSKKYFELCYHYRVKPVGDGDQVECEGCGQMYVSLEDRMLRSPGTVGCPTCVQKEKWG